MKLRNAITSDNIEVTKMFYEMVGEAYPNRKLGEPEAFAAKVLEWSIDLETEIYITETIVNGVPVISGFIVCNIDRCEGLTEPVYHIVAVYVKPHNRSGRSAFMLYQFASFRAEALKMPLIGSAVEWAKGIALKLGGTLRAYEYERQHL